MRRALHMFLVLTVLAVLTPSPASADGLFSPWAGVNLGNAPVEGRRAFGVTAGAMGGGFLGGEFDFGFSPNFFDEPVDNSALTLMANLLIGIPIGGTTGGGVRPYGTGGLGLIRTQIDTPANDHAHNELGVNVGGGIMGFFSDHFGVRGDLRYFRNLTEGTKPDDLGPIDLGFDLGGLDFWRASIGIVIR